VGEYAVRVLRSSRLSPWRVVTVVGGGRARARTHMRTGYLLIGAVAVAAIMAGSTAVAQSPAPAACVVPAPRAPRPGRPALSATLRVQGDLNLTCQFDDVDTVQGVSSCAMLPKFGTGGNGKFLLPFPNFHGPQPQRSVHYEIRILKVNGPNEYPKSALDEISVDYASEVGRVVYNATPASLGSATLRADGSGTFQFTQLQRQPDVFTRDVQGKTLSGIVSWTCRDPK
jgi:hypothetical protein